MGTNYDREIYTKGGASFGLEYEQHRRITLHPKRVPKKKEIAAATRMVARGEDYHNAAQAIGTISYPGFIAWYNSGAYHLNKYGGDFSKAKDKYQRRCMMLARALHLARAAHAYGRDLTATRSAKVDENVARVIDPEGSIREREMARRIRELEDRLEERDANDDAGY